MLGEAAYDDRKILEVFSPDQASAIRFLTPITTSRWNGFVVAGSGGTEDGFG